MPPTVIFRDFEERDIDFIYRCKNDEKLNSMIVGQWHPFTYEEACDWVHGCMGEHETYKFWAIATNDEEKRIVGWVALSNIDRTINSAETHSVVIGDPEYHDGFSWLESVLHLLRYGFETLHLHRIYGKSLLGHAQSNQIESLLYMTREGVLRDAYYKNNRYYDISLAGILEEEYFFHKEAGDYEMKSIIRHLRQLRKNV